MHCWAPGWGGHHHRHPLLSTDSALTACQRSASHHCSHPHADAAGSAASPSLFWHLLSRLSTKCLFSKKLKEREKYRQGEQTVHGSSQDLPSPAPAPHPSPPCLSPSPALRASDSPPARVSACTSRPFLLLGSAVVEQSFRRRHLHSSHPAPASGCSNSPSQSISPPFSVPVTRDVAVAPTWPFQ